MPSRVHVRVWRAPRPPSRRCHYYLVLQVHSGGEMVPPEACRGIVVVPLHYNAVMEVVTGSFADVAEFVLEGVAVVAE